MNLHDAVPTKRSSHYVKWVLIVAIIAMGVSLVFILSLLWICSLSKKERAARRYKEVKKQFSSESSIIDGISYFTISYPATEKINTLVSLL